MHPHSFIFGDIWIWAIGIIVALSHIYFGVAFWVPRSKLSLNPNYRWVTSSTLTTVYNQSSIPNFKTINWRIRSSQNIFSKHLSETHQTDWYRWKELGIEAEVPNNSKYYHYKIYILVPAHTIWMGLFESKWKVNAQWAQVHYVDVTYWENGS